MHHTLTDAELKEQSTQQLVNLVYTDYGKGDIEIQKVDKYKGERPKLGHVFYTIKYVYKGTGQIIYDGAYEMNKRIEEKLIENDKLTDYLLTKLIHTLRDGEFTEKELAAIRAEYERRNKTTFKQRIASWLRGIK